MADVREDAMRRGGELDVNLNISGGASKGITGNNSDSFGGKQQKTLTEQLKKMAGIDIGVGALLKQSQIFTGFLGNLFAIVGALIDTVLAPLAPMAFKALGHLGKIIPKIAEMAGRWIPKIAGWIEGIITKIDKFFKQFDPSWAKKALYILGGILAANMAMKMMMMTGRMAGSVLGLRQGGLLNMGARGGIGLGRSLAGRGVGGTIAAAGSALMGTRMLSGFRGGGGGGAGGTAVGGTGTGVSSHFARSSVPGLGMTSGTGGAPAAAASKPAGWASPYSATGKYVGNQTKPPSGTNLANSTRPASVPQGTIKGGMSRLGRLGGLRAMGRVPVVGLAISGAMAYAGGREQGMSQGKSAARGVTVGAATMAGAWGGAKLGAALGTPFGPAGMAIGGLAGGVIGGGIGAWGASGGFDALFGGKKGGGSGPYNLDMGGAAGAAGYRAPLFVAEAAEFWSEQVRKDGAVLDDHTVEVEANKKALADEKLAREKFAEYLAHVEKVGTHTGLTSMEKDSMDDAEDIGTGGSTIAGGLFKDPAVAAAEKAAEEEKARKANEEFMKQQRIANDKMIAEDQAEADRAHKEYMAELQRERELLATQFKGNTALENNVGGTLGNPLSAENQIKLELTSKAFESEEIFVARNIGNRVYQATAYTDEDP